MRLKTPGDFTRWRQRHNLHPDGAARLLDRDAKTLQDWELGNRPVPATVASLCAAIDELQTLAAQGTTQ